MLFFLENWDKSSSQHLHLRKSFIEARAKVLRLEAPIFISEFPLFLPGSLGENFPLHCTPLCWASTISDLTLGTSIPVAGHPLWHAPGLYASIGPLVLEGLSAFISLPSPWIHTLDPFLPFCALIPHPFSSHYLHHPLYHLKIHVDPLKFNHRSSRSQEMLLF